MPSRKVELKLAQKRVFIASYTPYDFQEFAGQYAVKITYTNGDIDMFTTETTMPNHFTTHEFDSDEQYFEFLAELKRDGIPMKAD
jgi:hypothetical protein